MLERISFALVNNRGRYTHFIHLDGTIACLKPLEALHEARVGVMVDSDFPNEAQYDAIELLAAYAIGENPAVFMQFEEATAPFAARFRAGDPINAFLQIIDA